MTAVRFPLLSDDRSLPVTDKFAGSEPGLAQHARMARVMDGPSPSNHRHADLVAGGRSETAMQVAGLDGVDPFEAIRRFLQRQSSQS